MTIHAETVNKLSAPMTLQPQAAEHHAAQQPDRPSSPVKTHGQARDDACDLIHDPPPERHVLRRHPAGGHGEA